MVDPNTRQGKRTPVTLKIKFKSETLEQFIERYAVDVSQGGIFIRTKEPLAGGSVLERILSEKAKQAPARPAGETTRPPMFTDTPTKVAPLPVQEALLGDGDQRKRSDSFEQHTPLPRPMPRRPGPTTPEAVA